MIFSKFTHIIYKMIGYKEFDFYMEENMNWSSLEMKNMSIHGKYISHNNTRYESQKQID